MLEAAKQQDKTYNGKVINLFCILVPGLVKADIWQHKLRMEKS